ncbi:ParB/RepB/Spo0J family partition protein [Isoptericola dokdonensis]|uniref:Putative chromosome-partitioning protein ParB n=1 Tax=Isoptericola dokdonensis DS-3 TaxID=1300344 RepID=A0A168FKZ4_9MICO|nr:ParB/RepB/Spo0J family partition protein [Isoptericola dokdonensis]ANC32049.1 putative chromosome-partitioning protein ParB [Isoptericola dokdonensis DS-3]
MSQKKRGLGRGLGALIPQGPPQEKPVDVFFPSTDATPAAPTTVVEEDSTLRDGAPDSASSASRGDRRTASWDSAIAGGRLAINSQPRGAAGDSSPDALSELAGLATRLEAEASDSGIVQDLGVVTTVMVAEHDAPEDLAAATATGELPQVAAESVTPLGTSDDDLVPVPGARFAEISVGAIRPNARQPRTVFDESDLDELVDSISQIGVLQPIIVRPDPEVDGTYELIMGERRWRASQAAGLEVIPAIVRETEDSQMLRDALLENLHRAALNPLEEAAAYRQLLDDFGCTHEELAVRIARSRPQISNTLRLLKLPPLVQRRVAAGVLSAGHARALLGLTDGAEIERLAQRIVSEGLSVRATEEIVTLLADGSEEKAARRSPRAGQRSEAMTELATRLSDRFETRVKVDLGKTKGRMTVEFASVEDLNRILAVMAPSDPGLLKP